jgi:hypothetical protein
VLDKGPELLGEILSRLFTARGWGRRQDRLRLEQAWADSMVACGLPPDRTLVNGLRRGVLDVLVGNATLLQEVAQFHKRKLLEQMRSKLAGMTINDLRFRAGNVKQK